ncbi:MAG: tetratricopeptide repeat protein [Burkholderiales bacterium]|nr:tetratricopeptide repeat protein [Burkholderiales bacterium]
MKSKSPRLPAIDPLLARAAELFGQGDHAAAEAICRSALALDPRSSVALHLLGVIALARPDAALALEHFEAALKASPRDVFVLIDHARALQLSGQPARALQSLAKAEGAARNAPTALLAVAAQYERLGELARAQALYQRVVKAVPAAVEAWIGLGNIQARAQRFADAEASYNRAQRLQPGHPDLLGNLGNLALAQGDRARAESLYRRAIETDPRNALAHYNLAQLLFDSDRAEEAYACFATAVALQPDFVEPALKLAALTADLGRLREAAEMYARIEQSHPTCTEARYHHGIALLALDRLDQARAHFQRFAADMPAVELAHAGLGNALIRLGQMTQAEQAFRAALACAPESFDALLDLCDALFIQGRDAEATALIEQASGHDRVRLCRGVAEVHYARGRASAALPYYEALAARDPADAEVRARRGEILLLRAEPSPAAWAGMSEWARRARTAPDAVPPAPLPELAEVLGADDPSLLVKTEQGIGDELFFLRFARLAAERGVRVLFQASDKLARVLEPRTLDFAQVLAPGDALPPVTASLRITDLPQMLRHPEGAAPFPATIALAPDAARRAHVQERLAALGPAPYIGVTWRAGAAETRLDWLARDIRAFSKRIPPRQLGAALRDIAGTVLILQRLPAAQDMAELQAGLGRAAFDLSAENEDLEAMLALLASLDDYIGVSNTNMHLMAALGGKARVLVPSPAEWRWMESGEESPWFPGFRVYRQSPLGDWSAALAALRNDLAGCKLIADAQAHRGAPMTEDAAATKASAPAEAPASAAIAATGGPLISAEYLRMQEGLHRDPNYGVASVEFAPMVAQFIRAQGISEMLDYGAGKGRLGQALRSLVQTPLRIHHYEPALPQWSAKPAPCELVACIDVLEHIEPELLDNVLDDLQRVLRRYGMFTIATGPAGKLLADGRNAHLIQQPASWWLPRLMARFELVHFDRVPRGFLVVVERKARG